MFPHVSGTNFHQLWFKRILIKRSHTQRDLFTAVSFHHLYTFYSSLVYEGSVCLLCSRKGSVLNECRDGFMGFPCFFYIICWCCFFPMAFFVYFFITIENKVSNHYFITIFAMKTICLPTRLSVLCYPKFKSAPHRISDRSKTYWVIKTYFLK